MNKDKFLELANLYLMNELDENEKREFENIIQNSAEFYHEFEKVKKLYDTLINNRPDDVDEELLTSARKSLFITLRSEAEKKNVLEKIIEWAHVIFTKNYKFALSGIGLLLIGFFLGYYLFSSKSEKPMIEISHSIDIDKIKEEGMKISNVRFQNTEQRDGEIEIMFDAVKPISYKGSLNDPFIQRLLATALITESNPGVRIRTINTLAIQTESKQFTLDPKIKAALITALKVDNNPAVRREALNLLMKFPFDEEIRDAYLFVLSNDSNSGLRIAAINALAQLKIQGNSLDEKIINVLNKKAEADNDDFIKLRAASLIKEVE